jgi:hypothetical protein
MQQLHRKSVVVSLALHGLALVGLSWFALQPLQPGLPAQPILVWLIPPTAPNVPEPAPVDLASAGAASEPTRAEPAPSTRPPIQPEPRREPSRERERQKPAGAGEAVTPTGAGDETPLQSTPPRPRPSLSPAEARQRAVDSVLEERQRGSSYRSFTFPGTIAEQQKLDADEALRRSEAGLQAPLTVFDSPSKGRAGLDEHAVPGEHFRWVSDACYQNVEMNTAFAFVPLMTPTLCARSRPREDLFVSAKPTYLMGAEERQAATKRVQRLEHLLRPTTDAVMPLQK